MRRRLARWFAWLGIVILGLVAAGWLVLRTNWARVQLGRLAARQAERFIDADVTIGRVDGNLYSTVILEGVVIRDEGFSIIEIRRLSVHYNLFDLVRGGRTFSRVELDAPIVALKDDSGFALSRLLKPRAASAQPGVPIRIDEFVVRNGTVMIGPEPAQFGDLRVPDRIIALAAELHITEKPEGLEIQIHRLSMQAFEPNMTVTAVRGSVLAGARDLTFDDLTVQLIDTAFTID